MQLHFLILAAMMVVPGSNINAASFEEISAFATNICGKVKDGGEFTRQRIEGEIKGELKGIAKLLGASVGAEGKLIIDDTEYKGLPYDKLSENMMDERECKLKLAVMLIDAQKKIKQESRNGFRDNNDGTITHDDTGLMWFKETSGIDVTWHKANSTCKASTTGGYTDWRLPVDDEIGAHLIGQIDMRHDGDRIWTSTKSKTRSGKMGYLAYNTINKNSYADLPPEKTNARAVCVRNM